MFMVAWGKHKLETFGVMFRTDLHSGKLTLQWGNGPFEDVSPIKNGGLFHCYVSLPEGTLSQLGCPRKLGSMVTKWVISPTYKLLIIQGWVSKNKY